MVEAKIMKSDDGRSMAGCDTLPDDLQLAMR